MQLQKKNVRNVCGNGRMQNVYGIAHNQRLDKEHLLALKLLIEYIDAFKSFDIALRSGERKKVAQIAHLAKILTETVQCFGSIFGADMSCFKVLDQCLFFDSFTIGIYEPLIAFTAVKHRYFQFHFVDFQNVSPRTQRDDALNSEYDDGQGLLMQLSNAYGQLDVMYFNCAPFSTYADGHQILFFGGNTVLRISGLTYIPRNASFDKYIVPVEALLNMIRGQPIGHHAITDTRPFTGVYRDAFRDIVRNVLRCRTRTASGGYMFMSHMVMYHLERSSTIRLLYSDLMTKCKWMNCIFKLENSQFDVLNIVNIAVLFRRSDQITFVLEDIDFIGTEEWRGETQWQLMVRQLPAIYDIGLTTTISFEFPPQMQWQQQMLFNDAFAHCPRSGSQWTRNIKLSGNKLSFEVEQNAAVRAELLKERGQEMCDKLS